MSPPGAFLVRLNTVTVARANANLEVEHCEILPVANVCEGTFVVLITRGG